jgi:hypothetical protein
MGRLVVLLDKDRTSEEAEGEKEWGKSVGLGFPPK